MKMCNCIELVNKELKGYNTRLVIPISLNQHGLKAIEKVVCVTEKDNARDKRKAVKIFATYCPFCGKKYEEEK